MEAHPETGTLNPATGLGYKGNFPGAKATLLSLQL